MDLPGGAAGERKPGPLTKKSTERWAGRCYAARCHAPAGCHWQGTRRHQRRHANGELASYSAALRTVFCFLTKLRLLGTERNQGSGLVTNQRS